MRFDFHPTSDGWRISEVNSDVPGGFTEASFFTGIIAAQYPDAKPAGNPVELWADAIAARAGSNGKVSLLSAPGFMEDHQIMAYLAGHLQKRGCATHLANPGQLRWHDGFANLETKWFSGKLDAVVRFYQAEWLPSNSHQCGWTHFFRGGQTPVANPGCAVIPESKRFPLVWDSLTTQLPIWRKALPQTRDVREAPWRTDESWIVKATISNTGDDVCIRELMKPRDWQWLRWRVRFEPQRWIAQRRSDSVPIETPLGPMHVCVGVYTIDGVAAGAYVRLAKKALIDYSSVDAALLVENEL
jgi:glutathionylspermidine synthase